MIHLVGIGLALSGIGLTWMLSHNMTRLGDVPMEWPPQARRLAALGIALAAVGLVLDLTMG